MSERRHIIQRLLEEHIGRETDNQYRAELDLKRAIARDDQDYVIRLNDYIRGYQASIDEAKKALSEFINGEG